ncbi:MAG: hypothetical protein JWM53_507 [bacterium]|nr:hypothetical protein [bacterium]
MPPAKKERTLYRCPLCSKISPPAAFDAGARGDDTHSLQAKTVTFIGGGREGKPKEQARDATGNLKYDAAGNPVMVLLRDDHGKPIAGRGFDWATRDLTFDERLGMVRMARALANRLSLELIRDVLMSAGGDQFEQLCDEFQQEAATEYDEREQLIESIKVQRYFDD